jgi:hypothetical protein
VEEEWDARVVPGQVVGSWAVWLAALAADGLDRGLLEAVAEVDLVWVVQGVPGLVLAEQEQDAQVSPVQVSVARASAAQASVTQVFVTQVFVTQVFVTRFFFAPIQAAEVSV